MERLELLSSVGEVVAGYLDHANKVGDGVPTPCAAWSVRHLGNHLVGGNVSSVALLTEAETPDRSGDYLGHDWAEAQRSSVEALVSAFSQPGVMTRVYRAPAGEVPGAVLLNLRTVEHAVHGWDLAVATGQPVTALNAAAEAMYESSVALLGRLPDLMSRRPFDARVDVGSDRQPIDRLVALLGRDPDWTVAG